MLPLPLRILAAWLAAWLECCARRERLGGLLNLYHRVVSEDTSRKSSHESTRMSSLDT
jgi:hypothetical protein